MEQGVERVKRYNRYICVIRMSIPHRLLYLIVPKIGGMSMTDPRTCIDNQQDPVIVHPMTASIKQFS